jgi:cytidylate kinase
MENKFTITVGRQLGCGGHQIGEKLASVLNIAFYDKELIYIASKESGLGKEFFEQADENTSFDFLGNVFGYQGVYSDEFYTNNFLNNETLFKLQSDVIRELAGQKSAVFVGRCADYVLKDNPRCLNIFITADFDDRLKRIMDKENLPEHKATDLIEKTDKKRASYYNYYSNKTWGTAGSYHLCINSSVLGIDETVNFIRQFAAIRFGL